MTNVLPQLTDIQGFPDFWGSVAHLDEGNLMVAVTVSTSPFRQTMQIQTHQTIDLRLPKEGVPQILRLLGFGSVRENKYKALHLKNLSRRNRLTIRKRLQIIHKHPRHVSVRKRL